jgi:hypothetical protein
MTEQRFDLILTGELAPGFERKTVVKHLAAVFKRKPEQVDKLLTGKPNRIRKDISQADLQRFQQHFEKIGAVCTFVNSSVAPDQASASVTVQPDEPETNIREPSSLQICPSGTMVLTANERQLETPTPANIGDFRIAPSGTDLSEGQTRPPVASVDVSHLSVAATGADLSDKQSSAPATIPPLDHLSLAKPGEDLLLTKNTAVKVDLDALCGDLNLAGIGRLLSDKVPLAQLNIPDISHLKLE